MYKIYVEECKNVDIKSLVFRKGDLVAQQFIKGITISHDVFVTFLVIFPLLPFLKVVVFLQLK